MNNRQKVINKITKSNIEFYKKILDLEFRKTRRMIRRTTNDLDFHTLLIYKNLG